MNHELPQYNKQENLIPTPEATQDQTVETDSERESRLGRVREGLAKYAGVLLFAGMSANLITQIDGAPEAIANTVEQAASATSPWATAMMLTGGAVAVGHSAYRKRLARQEQAQQRSQEVPR